MPTSRCRKYLVPLIPTICKPSMDKLMKVHTSIEMRQVVLFKSESEDYRHAFGQAQFETLFVEPLSCEPLQTAAGTLASKLQNNEYTGLIITSQRAVDAILKCSSLDDLVHWNSKKVYTVGETTSELIKKTLNLQPVGMMSGNAEKLAQIIVDENEAGSCFLFPCGNLRSETIIENLKEKSMNVDALTVYETKQSDKLKSELMRINDLENVPCGMVFFSPSGCEYTYRQLQTFNNKLSTLPHFAIGNSTAHKIQNLGLDIAGVADKPKAQNMADIVLKYFAETSSAKA